MWGRRAFGIVTPGDDVPVEVSARVVGGNDNAVVAFYLVNDRDEAVPLLAGVPSMNNIVVPPVRLSAVPERWATCTVKIPDGEFLRLVVEPHTDAHVEVQVTAKVRFGAYAAVPDRTTASALRKLSPRRGWLHRLFRGGDAA